MDTHAWINTVGVLLTLTVTIYLASKRSMASHERELAEIRVKVETMWNFLLKRGVVEGTSAGLLTVNSPIRLTEQSSRIMQEWEPSLIKFRQEKCPQCDERELALAIEREFGDRLVYEVCIPNRISSGVCLLIATAVAKGGKTLTEILDEYAIPAEMKVPEHGG